MSVRHRVTAPEMDSDFTLEELFGASLLDQTDQQIEPAGELMVCRVCGCDELHACPGGCVWAKPYLCSRCARLEDAA